MLVTPFINACFIFAPVTGCASVGFAPKTKIQSVLSKSFMEFVAAPVPKACCIPNAVGAWQTLAQPSILLVPIAIRVIFCIK